MITGSPDAYQVTGDPLDIIAGRKKEVVSTVLKINAGIAKMTKAKIEEHGRELGVELDRRMTKPNMIKDLKSKLK